MRVISVLLHSVTAVALVAPVSAQRVSDSSGIRIVRYGSPEQMPTVALSTPALIIGDGPCLMNRVVGVLTQQTGNVVVANAGNLELCIYDSKGAFVRRFGRDGGGPGEFRGIQSVHLLKGDSLLLVDHLIDQAVVYGSNRSYRPHMRMVSPDSSLGSHASTIVLQDGTLILGFSEFKTGRPSPQAVMFRQRLTRTAADGRPLNSIGSFPMSEHFIQATTPERGGVAYYSLTFGRNFSSAPFGEGFVGGEGSDFDIREYSSAGRLRAIHRLDAQRKPLTSSEISSIVDRRLSAAKDRAREELILREMPFPSHYPAYRRILTEDGRRIWLELYSSASWIVLDAAKGTGVTAAFPKRFQLHTITNGKACGVGRNDDDLETIYCYAVPR